MISYEKMPPPHFQRFTGSCLLMLQYNLSDFLVHGPIILKTKLDKKRHVSLLATIA